nr:MAG TPA: hypothetical protein [Caudoviricetes sp.]
MQKQTIFRCFLSSVSIFSIILVSWIGRKEQANAVKCDSSRYLLKKAVEC